MDSRPPQNFLQIKPVTKSSQSCKCNPKNPCLSNCPSCRKSIPQIKSKEQQIKVHCGCISKPLPPEPHDFSTFLLIRDWDKLRTREDFLLIFSLKSGTNIIDVLGFLCGLLGLIFLIAFLVDVDSYKAAYADKINVLIFLISLSTIMLTVLIASVWLYIAVIDKSSKYLKQYLWIICIHFLLIVIYAFIVIIYSLCDNLESGVATSVIVVIFTFFYGCCWWYCLVTVNSYRMIYIVNVEMSRLLKAVQNKPDDYRYNKRRIKDNTLPQDMSIRTW